MGAASKPCTLIIKDWLDHCLLVHSDQVALINNKLPAKIVGSLCETVKIDSILAFVEEIIYNDDPELYFKKISAFLKKHFVKSNDSTTALTHETSLVLTLFFR